MQRNFRIIFFGSSEFAIPILQQLLEQNYEVVASYTQPPKSANRGKKITLTPVHKFSQSHGVLVKHPLKLNTPEAISEFKALEPDFAIVVSYGLLIPKSFLDIPKIDFMNVHPSLLPRWRGAAPMQRTLMDGDTKTAVCIIRIVEELDAGPIFQLKEYAIPKGITYQELSEKLAQMGGNLLVDTIEKYHELTPQKQNIKGVTYASKIRKEEAKINWSESAKEVSNTIHGLSPSPGAWTLFQNTRIKILKCQPSENSGSSGSILDKNLTIGCGQFSIIPLLLQKEGKRPLELKEFLKGFRFEVGDTFQ